MLSHASKRSAVWDSIFVVLPEIYRVFRILSDGNSRFGVLLFYALVHYYHAGHLHYKGQHVREGESEIESREGMVLWHLEEGGDPEQSYSANGEYRGERGGEGASHTAHGGDRYVGAGVDEYDYSDHLQLCNACGDLLGGVGVEGDKRLCVNYRQSAHYNSEKVGQRLSPKVGFYYALVVIPSEILAGKGNYRLRNGAEGGKEQGFDGAGCAVTCHCYGAECVDGGLNYHVCKVEHSAMESRGQTDCDYLTESLGGNSQLGDGKAYIVALTHEADDGEYSGDGLREDGGESNSCNVHFQHDNEEQVQEDVQHTCQGEEVHGALGVSYRS